MSIEAMKLALDAIANSGDFLFNWHDCEPNNEREMSRYQEVSEMNEKAFTALRTAIEEAAQPAPVQESSTSYPMTLTCTRCGAVDKGTLTVPNIQRQWVGLTDEEKHRIYRSAGLSAYHLPDSVVQYQYDRCLDEYVSAIEAKLKEKNT